jgi:hypothetical protein
VLSVQLSCAAVVCTGVCPPAGAAVGQTTFVALVQQASICLMTMVFYMSDLACMHACMSVPDVLSIFLWGGARPMAAARLTTPRRPAFMCCAVGSQRCRSVPLLACMGNHVMHHAVVVCEWWLLQQRGRAHVCIQRSHAVSVLSVLRAPRKHTPFSHVPLCGDHVLYLDVHMGWVLQPASTGCSHLVTCPIIPLLYRPAATASP